MFAAPHCHADAPQVLAGPVLLLGKLPWGALDWERSLSSLILQIFSPRSLVMKKKQSFHGGFKTEDRSVRGQADALTLYLQICHEIPERQEDCIFEICNFVSQWVQTQR